MEDHSDNIFDEDDSLDFIMSEEVEKDAQEPKTQSGCLGLIVLLIMPAGLLGWILSV
jgi:hypothetical protein